MAPAAAARSRVLSPTKRTRINTYTKTSPREMRQPSAHRLARPGLRVYRRRMSRLYWNRLSPTTVRHFGVLHCETEPLHDKRCTAS